MDKKLHIIIIDDEEDLVANLRDILAEKGYLVENAFDGKSGLELCRQKKFDVALVDINLPDIPGNEIVRKIAKVSPKTECILITGYASLEGAIEAVRQKEVVAYETKPLEIDRIIAFLGEIIKRRQAEEALVRSERRYYKMAELLPDMIYELDTSMKITYANQAAFEIMGYTEQDLEAGIYLSDIIAKDDLERARQKLEERAKGIHPSIAEYTLYLKDGSPIICEVTSAAARDEEGVLVGFYGIMRDITTRRQSEEERLSLVTAIEQSAEVIIMTDRDGLFQYVNPSFERISGYTCEDIIGHDFSFLKSSKHDESFYRDIRYTMSRGDVWIGRIFNRKKNGSLFEVETSISPVQDRSGNVTHFVVVQRDVSHEVELERQLHQAQKMEAIGTLAGGIAHDFNNILGAIIGYTEMVKMFDIPKDSPVQNRLQQILQAADRAKNLVQQILTFSRQTEAEQRPVLFSPIVKEALKFLRASLPSTIEIHQDIKTETGTVQADPTQIHQVLMNLCTNAAHAMSTTGGVLEVGLINVDLDDRIIAERFVGLEPGPYIMLRVKDTGHGMDNEIMDRIFDPYFTTKEPGRGTGMGLSVVHGIVKSHNGAIMVNSEIGKGSNFEVFFPRLEKEKVESDAGLPPSLPTGNERILFVDDEETIADIGQKILESLGYKTIVETDSIKALDVFRDQADQFDLVITDLTMPGMTGLELARKLLFIRPDLPIILCTGFGEAVRKEKALGMGLRGFVSKPFGASSLAETVRKVLDEPSM